MFWSVSSLTGATAVVETKGLSVLLSSGLLEPLVFLEMFFFLAEMTGGKFQAALIKLITLLSIKSYLLWRKTYKIVFLKFCYSFKGKKFNVYSVSIAEN